MPMFDYICEVCGHDGRKWRREKPPRFCCRACRNRGMAGQTTKGTKYVITPEMHIKIKQIYQTMTGNGEVRDLAAEFGLPRCKITRYAIKQGWIARQKKEPDWSERELKILSNSAHLCPERIQKNLKIAGFSRSATGIVLKRKRMRFLSNLKGHSARNVAECFGVDETCISGWIKKGYMKAGRRGTKRTSRQGGDQWFIKDKWIRDFVVNYTAVIDFRKIDKYWITDLLAGGEIGTGPSRVVDINPPEIPEEDYELAATENGERRTENIYYDSMSEMQL